MKTILQFLAIGITAFAGLGTTAQAGHWRTGAVIGSYVRCYSSCGCPVHVQRYIAGFDRCGNPVYGERVLAVSHRCRPLVRVGPPRPINPPVIAPRHRGGPCVTPPPPCFRDGGRRDRGLVIAGIRFR